MQSTNSDLHEELKMVLPAIQNRKNKLDFKKTPDIFIDQVGAMHLVHNITTLMSFISGASTLIFIIV